MAGTKLSLRNLTAIPLELRLVESFESPRLLQKKSEGFFSNVTSVFTNASTAPQQCHLEDGKQTYVKRDQDLRLPPFQTRTTGEAAPQGETLRLTFDAGTERYRIDISSRKQESQHLLPLVPSPKFDFTGVYCPDIKLLTIYSSADLSSWMQHLPDSTPLSALSIPGTHNSPTCHRALPSVRCQAVDPLTQLDNGIRFLDIRVQPDASRSRSLTLVHAVFPISLTGPKYLDTLMTTIYDWLAAHPSETIIISLKREGTGSATDADLARILHDHYAGDSNHRSRWYTLPTIPTLASVRGKIVLMRRFALPDDLHDLNDGRGWGIDAECWADNTACDLHGSVCVQDFYQVTEVENVTQKLGYVTAHLQRAAECVCPVPGVNTDLVNPVPPGPFYLNFLSASNFWRVGCWPERIAGVLNPKVVEWLCGRHGVDSGHGDGQTGIVVCDWVGSEGEWGLVRCVVGMNAKLAARGTVDVREKEKNHTELK